jgi:hypothetical protein
MSRKSWQPSCHVIFLDWPACMHSLFCDSLTEKKKKSKLTKLRINSEANKTGIMTALTSHSSITGTKHFGLGLPRPLSQSLSCAPLLRETLLEVCNPLHDKGKYGTAKLVNCSPVKQGCHCWFQGCPYFTGFTVCTCHLSATNPYCPLGSATSIFFRHCDGQTTLTCDSQSIKPE